MRCPLPAAPPPRLRPGFGNHLARPLMREKHRPDMGEEEAVALMHECLKVRARSSLLTLSLTPLNACVIWFLPVGA